jgi:Trypsin-co-occurring domain 1
VAEFVRYRLDDGSEVVFETAESDLVSLRGGAAVQDGGRLSERLSGVAKAAEQIAGELRSRMTPDELSLEFGIKVSGELNWWFLAKSQGETAIKITVKWTNKATSGKEAGGRPLEG